MHLNLDSLVTVNKLSYYPGFKRLKARTLHADLWIEVADRRTCPILVSMPFGNSSGVTWIGLIQLIPMLIQLQQKELSGSVDRLRVVLGAT